MLAEVRFFGLYSRPACHPPPPAHPHPRPPWAENPRPDPHMSDLARLTFCHCRLESAVAAVGSVQCSLASVAMIATTPFFQVRLRSPALESRKDLPFMFRNSFAVSFAAALTAVVLAVGSAKAEVVYGNLGSSGTNAIASTGGVGIASAIWRAIGFTVSGTNLQLDTATIGFNVSAAGSATIRLDLYTNGSGTTPGTSLFNTSQLLAANTVNQPITFNFGQLLTSGSTYWIVAQRTAGTGVVTWRPASPQTAPGTQNSSGWTSLGNVTGITSSNSGTSWGSTGNGQSSSISLTAVVPEPSTWAMAGAGLALAGTYGVHRRRRRVSGKNA